ncbi:glycosyltransferase [Nocardia cyriacigeorgica]|uniref:glycosyltransferase family 2 protein n=1 Tax=Nocardia cyriacigeorgica TaxID=135487 RepID=UPI0018937F1E|nr:glycosyltransferase [Nocardia cyriacigeorgica]MBF6102162.1 glycosyltransferase [Nocardia cyriacigeorgica]MBF6347345.1 glycosyltransferase [Nocardia cyriacigeorgica]MBF6518467.1 glycosyltransferase [Nocardia cyriacigeorgica]
MLISVLTAVHQPSAAYLPETLASIAAQELPAGWELEWVLQEDGPDSEIAELAAGHDWVRYSANGEKLGIAGTRNLALNRVRGSLVQVLDSDDLLLPTALATLIPHFADPSIHWALGQADDLLPDGTRKAFPPYDGLPFGRVPAGAVNTWALDTGGSWPVHCAGLMLRSTSVRAMGGWGGVPTNDDLVMLAGVSGAADGYFDDTVTWLYRQHETQTVRGTRHRIWGDDTRRMALQRAVAVRNSGLRLPDASPTTQDVEYDVQIAPSLKAAVPVDPK